MIYAVLKCGVYIQGVYGPFGTEQDAIDRAISLGVEDTDNYHSYIVVTLDPVKGESEWLGRRPADLRGAS
jgi:hypothetical protein